MLIEFVTFTFKFVILQALNQRECVSTVKVKGRVSGSVTVEEWEWERADCGVHRGAEVCILHAVELP